MAAVKPIASHVGFLRHAGLRWAKVAIWLCILSIAAYIWHAPEHGANGGTWLGYTLGGMGAALILWLLWLGVRKRRYSSSLGTVKGWTSAHVYLGLSLLVIATLHTGFQFGLNIHTVGYGLMVAVILSGLWGLVAYGSLPSRISQQRDGGTREAWVDEVFDLNDQAIKLADQMGPEIHQRIVASAEKLKLGGNLREQLRLPGKSADTDYLRKLLDEQAAKIPEKFDPNRQSTVMFMAGQIQQAADGGSKAAKVQQLLDLLTRRNDLITRINRDIRLHAQLQLWLLFHVPLSFALLAALIAHVVSVFFYW